MKKSKQEIRQIVKRSFGVIFILVFFALSFLILFESGKDAEESTKSSSMVIEIIQTIIPSTKGSDMSWVRKVIGHYGLFAVCAFSGLLGVLLFDFSKKKRNICYVIIAIWMLAQAIASEWIQTTAPGRGPSWVDVGIDSLGSLTAFLLLFFIHFLLYSIRHQKERN